MKKIPKEEIYKHWNFTVSKYDFEIPSGKRAWEVLPLIELKTIKKQWSDEMGAYYNQNHYITVSEDQLNNFLSKMAIC